MQCTSCHIPMLVENEVKENGFCFAWYRCSSCNETYLSKTPVAKKTEKNISDSETVSR